jgi:hypothetical protein
MDFESALKISIYGVNHGSEMKYNPNDFSKNHLCLVEFPLTQTESASSFSLLNSKDAEYFKSKELFVSHINKYFYENFGFEVTESSLSSIFDLKNNYDFFYPIGSYGEDFNSINELRFKRSVSITNNILGVLSTYSHSLENLLKNNPLTDYIIEGFNYPINTVSIIIGGPHLKFVNHFLSKKYNIVKLVNLVDKYAMKYCEGPKIDIDIKNAELQNLIGFQ